MLKEQKKKISEISDEKTFREDVLRILFDKMGCKGVEVTHGPNEHGKDLVFYTLDHITEQKKYYAVVAKIGKLTAGTGKELTHIVNIKNQITTAFDIPYKDTYEKRENKINYVWVISNSTISDPAKSQIISLFGETAGIMERNVHFIDEKNLIDWISKYWPEFFISGNPFILEYCSHMKANYEKLVELKTLGYKKEIRNLFDIYIEPTLIEERKGSKKSKRPIEFIKYSTDEILKDNHNYWITGPLGSGKSTVLQKSILQVTQALEKDQSNGPVPITFRFKELIKDNAALAVNQLIIDTLNKCNVFEYKIDPLSWLKDGKIILFLDGFDEIYKDKLMDSVLTKLNEFMQNYPNIKVIATSRDSGLEKIEHVFTAFCRLEIRPMSFKQMTQFLTQWFQRRRKRKEEMLDVLRNTVFANKLPRTPMVLTLLAILFDEKPFNELPANLTELYSMFTQLYLGRWDTERDVEILFDYSIKANILMDIANWMHENGIDRVTEDAIQHRIDNYAKERKIPVNTTELIDELINRSHLLYKDENENYGFKHLSFQEYFSSLHWEQRVFDTDQILKFALDPWWENVIFFYVGKKKDAPEIIESFIKLSTTDVFEELHKILNLGQLLQAAYLTKHKIKVKSVNYAIDNLCNSFEGIMETIESRGLLDKMDLSETFLILMTKYMFAKNYTSATLLKALEEVFTETYDSSKFNDKVFFMKLYYLAYVLAVLGNKDHIEELATNPSHFDPIFSFMMRLDFTDLDEEYDIEISEIAVKKIGKRVKKSAEYLKGALKKKRKLTKDDDVSPKK